jgi:hypothetical protein
VSATLHLAFASGTAEAGAVIRPATDTMAALIVAIDGDLEVESAHSVTRLAGPGATFVHGADTTVRMPVGGRCMLWRLSSEPIGGGEHTLSVPTDWPIDRVHVLRLDLIEFPPTAVAYWHTHQGPGIRCLVQGTASVTFASGSRDHGAFEPWYEPGPEPVQVANIGQDTAVIARLLALPVELAGGKPSIRYTREEDAAKPRLQRYRTLLEAVIDPAEVFGA